MVTGWDGHDSHLCHRGESWDKAGRGVENSGRGTARMLQTGHLSRYLWPYQVSESRAWAIPALG